MTVAVTRWFTSLGAIPQASPVCAGSRILGRVVIDLLDGHPPFDIPCPHCVNPAQMLNVLETTRHAEAS